jgi:hypothetical protein
MQREKELATQRVSSRPHEPFLTLIRPTRATGPEMNSTLRSDVYNIVDMVESRLKPGKPGFLNLLKLGHTTPAETLKSGVFNVSFGCLEKAALMGALLKLKGFDVFMVSERAYHRGKTIALHFSLQVTDGKTQLTIDPHTKETRILEGWSSGDRQSNLSTPFQGEISQIFRVVKRKELPSYPMDTDGFGLAGIKGRLDYLRLAEVNWWKFSRFLASRVTGKYYKRVTRELERTKTNMAHSAT